MSIYSTGLNHVVHVPIVAIDRFGWTVGTGGQGGYVHGRRKG